MVVVAGGRPANFCDLGGGGSAEGVVDALEVIARDEQVRSILFNIFGGITRCDEVARGILAALERVEIAVPLVVRLDGTNAEEGRRILAEAAGAGHPRRADDARRRPSGRGARSMSDPWDERAQLYRESKAHSEGADLDLVVEWAAGARTAIDVATGGGHVARRLREAGLQVVSCDPSPGMAPDVICFAEELPFADASFDYAVTRVAAHHFADVGAAVSELARVARDRVVVVDNLQLGEAVEEAERIRDPSHVRNYSEAEWRDFFAAAGLAVEEVRRFDFPIELEPWLERTACTGDDAVRVRELLADRIADGWLVLDRIALLGRPR